MELYNEEILDLFDNASCSVSKSSNGPVGGLGKRSTSAGGSTGIRIHEDANGNIYTVRKMNLTVIAFNSFLKIQCTSVNKCAVFEKNR